MLSVKIIRPDRHEIVFEAREVEREASGILVQTDNDTLFYGPEGAMMSLDATCRQKDKWGDEPRAETATVYVMNRYGNTIATYTL
jgi:hypothetical protein